MNIDEQIERQIRKEKVMGAGSGHSQEYIDKFRKSVYDRAVAAGREAHRESKDPIYKDQQKNKGNIQLKRKKEIEAHLEKMEAEVRQNHKQQGTTPEAELGRRMRYFREQGDL